MLKRTFCLFWLFCLLPAGVSGASACTLLVVGDSISAAHGMARKEGWVQRLQQRLQDRSLPCRVVNASISGDTTAGGLRRLPGLLERHRPQVLLLELGGNDGLRGLSLKQMKRNLSTMIELARQSGARVLLLGVQLPPNYGEGYSRAFERVFEQLSREQQVPLVPSVVAGIGGNGALMQSDGIHPNAAAQPHILELVWPRLEPLLERLPGSESPQGAAQ